jgi:deoxycytidine triphosphate deaminase
MTRFFNLFKSAKAPMTELFPKGFNQRLLWQDPLEKTATPGTVLRGEEIQEYVEKHNLIIDRETFVKKNLKGASYSTNPDGSESWIFKPRIFRKKGRAEKLKQDRDSRGEYFIVPPNSFVFFRLRQKLRMPFYLIARFNLKIRYVYRGLLLGTGPQIDPGYTGRIYIPLHNFTNEPVNIYIDESFVSFEFERTAPLRLSGKNPKTLDEFYELYEDSLRLIKPEKIEGRNNLEAYLEGGRPYSALGVLVKQLRRMRSEFRRRKVIEWTASAAMVVLVGTYAISTYQFVHATGERQRQLQHEIDQVSKEQVQPQANLEAQMNALSEKVRELSQEVTNSRQELTRLRTPSPTPKSNP